MTTFLGSGSFTCKVTGPDGYQYEPVWINPKDAAKLGVKDGDVVKIYNDRGWVLRVLVQSDYAGSHPAGSRARIDPIEPGISDRSEPQLNLPDQHHF